jgi:hypothetical protein
MHIVQVWEACPLTDAGSAAYGAGPVPYGSSVRVPEFWQV